MQDQPTKTKIVRVGMDDHSAPNDRMVAMEGYLVVSHSHTHTAVGISCDVAQVAHMSFLGIRSAVQSAQRIEVSTGTHTAVRVVTKLVYMKPMISLNHT